jgi:hypothetical protein
MFLVAATRRGFTPWPAGWWRAWPPWPGIGVFVPGVATGVEKFEGSSEVKMVAVEGERMYREVRTERRAGVKPVSD